MGATVNDHFAPSPIRANTASRCRCLCGCALSIATITEVHCRESRRFVMNGFPDNVTLSAIDWPPGCRGLQPGECRFFVPQGFGLGVPSIITPYSGPAESTYYGFHEQSAHPFLNGPLTESTGGTLYFDDNVAFESLHAALELMGVYQTLDYVAFGESCTDSKSERYLDQMRLVSRIALEPVFGATITDPKPQQTLNILEATAAFVSAQKQKWNDSSILAGRAGGDGDWAKESLAFGFHVENTYWGIYRVWSRAWLVTK